MEEAGRICEIPMGVGMKIARKPHHDAKSRALAELAPNGNLSCILATSCPQVSLQTHYLYEVGGNIGKWLQIPILIIYEKKVPVYRHVCCG